MKILDFMAQLQTAGQSTSSADAEKMFWHGTKHEAQRWGLADCLIASCIMFNYDAHKATTYLHYVTNVVNEGIYEMNEIAEHLEDRMYAYGIKIK